MNTPHAQTIAQSVPRCPRYWPATRELVPPDGAIGAALGADLEGRKGRGERLLSAKWASKHDAQGRTAQSEASGAG